MREPTTGTGPDRGDQPDLESDWQRRKRIAAVFGDVLPETTGDERSDRPSNTGPSEDPGEAWLKAQVPPHHG